MIVALVIGFGVLAAVGILATGLYLLDSLAKDLDVLDFGDDS